ncbi:uncharacterized protein VNE69_07205 [Vairimorpha necatrix]|uniref:Uncharacterized protein n=1 Tax=Vairimorpha necatrix TaxID=6039 RepID=A0AAX4JDT9_9MICR
MSLNNILGMIKGIVKNVINFPTDNKIILMYEESEIDEIINFSSSITTGNVIIILKKEIIIEKTNLKSIMIKNIKNSVLEKTIYEEKIYNKHLNKKISSIGVHLFHMDIRRHYIKMRILTENNSHIFRLCIVDIFNLPKYICICKYNEIEIFNKLVELSKLSDDNFTRVL